MAIARTLLACGLSLSSSASAAVIPSWRINPINAAALEQAPSLDNALCVSLMIELTGSSQFAVAGIDLTSDLNGSRLVDPAVVRFYQRTRPGQPHPIDPAEYPTNPPLEFRTYLATTDITEGALVPGRLNGTGGGQFGQTNLFPTSGVDRVGQFFNVAWGAVTQSTPPGTYELARITMVVPNYAGEHMLVSIPITKGQVRDILDPTVAIALPPVPVPISIPEPTTCGMLTAAMSLLVIRLPRQVACP